MLSESSAWKKSHGTSPILSMTPNNPQQWLQVAGHEGFFHVGEYGTLLKRFCKGEQECYLKLMEDPMRPFVPEYFGVVQKDEKYYNMLDNLLTSFDKPAIMDCKIGSRTHTERELQESRECPPLRKDFYVKMVDLDPDAPTVQEHAQQAVGKVRYKQWRDSTSTTATLGFRIEGLKNPNKECHINFKKIKSRQQVMEAVSDFVESNAQTVWDYLRRLKQLHQVLESSQFFRTHEVVSTSLLFVHSHSGKTGVWMIDFGKTSALPPNLIVDHRSSWVEGNGEDGFLWGLENLMDVLTDILHLLKHKEDYPIPAQICEG